MLDLRPNPVVLILVPDDQPIPEQGRFIDDEEELLELLEQLHGAQAAETTN